MKNLEVFDLGNIFGTMNGSTIRLSNITDADKKMIMEMHNLSFLDADYKFTKEDKSAIHMNHRVAAGEKYGFDPYKMFMADQVNKNGSYHVLDRDYVEANPKGWTDINEDILIITNDVPGVVACHPVSDCPVIVMTDAKNGITAVGHCSAELIDKKLPMSMADALLDYGKTKDEDIFAYVSSCAGSGWTYEGIPAWLNDWKMWSSTHGIELEKENMVKDGVVTPKIYINLKNTIDSQLQERNIAPTSICYSNIDTITDPSRYSNHAASVTGLNQSEKFGRNLVGAFYLEEEEVKGRYR